MVESKTIVTLFKDSSMIELKLRAGRGEGGGRVAEFEAMGAGVGACGGLRSTQILSSFGSGR